MLALYREQTVSVNASPSLFLFRYDALGNLNQFTQLINSKIETGKLTSYNANGAFLAGTSTTGLAVNHSYTPRGQLASTSVAGQITTYTYDAIGQSKQVTYPNGDKLVYSYDQAHKLQSIQWNGIEQYTPIAGISSNLASLAGYSGITNPELAYKLGVNPSNLDALDAALKVLTEKTNAAARAAVELAKDALVGKEAVAQTTPATPIKLPGLSSIATLIELGGKLARGESLVYRPPQNCPDNNNEAKCEEGLNQDLNLCAAIAKPRYGVAGYAKCRASAMERYAQCLRSKKSDTPLAGVDTPI